MIIRLKHLVATALLVASGSAQGSHAQSGVFPVPTYETVPSLLLLQVANPNESAGDDVHEPRHIAALTAAIENAAPKMVIDIGSFFGKFVKVVIQQVPRSQSQWTELVTANKYNAAVYRPYWKTPPLTYQTLVLRAAGFVDTQVVCCRFNISS